MTSRKEKIKDKREQELKEQQQVRMAAAVIGVIMIVGVALYIAWQNDVFFRPYDPTTNGYRGTPDEICTQAQPFGQPTGNQFTQADRVSNTSIDYAAIFCTNVGAIYIDLFEDQAPITVNSMIFLANNNFYNGTIFHRVLEGFMAQGGDPTGTGMGGPGYEFADEVSSGLIFDRPYLLAMANSGPGTNGSQFFITFVPTDWLNGRHTIFGEVISGQNVVNSLMLRDPQMVPPGSPASTLLSVIIVTPSQVTIPQ
jgi:cyclophilin family peptidyl-prolyl cis-trans isomerase